MCRRRPGRRSSGCVTGSRPDPLAKTVEPISACFLNPSAIIGSDHPDVLQKARVVADGAAGGPVESAVRLYRALRDFRTEDVVGDTR
jgi:hypothetical protein